MATGPMDRPEPGDDECLDEPSHRPVRLGSRKQNVGVEKQPHEAGVGRDAGLERFLARGLGD